MVAILPLWFGALLFLKMQVSILDKKIQIALEIFMLNKFECDINQEITQ